MSIKKGYRVIKEAFLKELLNTNKPFLTNKNGKLNKGACNSFKKSNEIKCFWFFETLEDAQKHFWDVGGYGYVIAEFNIPTDDIYEYGKGCYCHDSLSGFYGGEFKEEEACNEFTTIKIAPYMFCDVHYDDDTTDTEEEEDFYSSEWFYLF